MKPRFDRPEFTVDANVLFPEGHALIDDAAQLPEFSEPAPLPVSESSNEELVAVEHRRIRTLANYWHGGWEHAIASTWLRRTVSDRLGQVADSLPEDWGLAIFDAWRSLALQRELYETAYRYSDVEPGFMAPPSTDPAHPPPHNTGGAVDLTLTYLGTPIAAGSKFDDTTKRAFTAHLEDDPGAARQVRRGLYHAMSRAGFVVYSGEWWHFEYGTGRWAAIAGNDPIFGSAEPPVLTAE